MKSTSVIILSALMHSVAGFTAAAAQDKPQPAPAAEGAAVQRTLSKEEMARLEKAVADSDLVAAVNLRPAQFTGVVHVHQAKVTKLYKGQPKTSSVFAMIHRDKTAPPPAGQPPVNPLPKIAPGDYVVVLERHEVISSFPRPAADKTYNYFIKHDKLSHFAWEKNSPEAAYVRELLTRKSL
jgi:hypothetical protein